MHSLCNLWRACLARCFCPCRPSKSGYERIALGPCEDRHTLKAFAADARSDTSGNSVHLYPQTLLRAFVSIAATCRECVKVNRP